MMFSTPLQESKKIKRHPLKVPREVSATIPVSDLSLNFQEGRKKITGLGEDEGEARR